jgi:hypothetical protein
MMKHSNKSRILTPLLFLFIFLAFLSIMFLSSAWIIYSKFFKYPNIENHVYAVVQNPTIRQVQLISDYCDIRRCLFSSGESYSQLRGTTTVSGYYQSHIVDYAIGPYPTPNLQECEEFVVVKAEYQFLQMVNFWIAYGNTVNRKLSDGSFAVSITSENGFLSKEEQDILYKSNPSNLVEISLFLPKDNSLSPLMYCVTWLDIIRVWPKINN